jgi:glycosyltransferase involved in cell wall biosynthesis
MTFTIITSVLHHESDGNFFGYGPYVREMNLWIKHVDKVIIVAPLKEGNPSAIQIKYDHENIEFIELRNFNILNFSELVKTLKLLPDTVSKIWRGMKAADHIHLRCPGNIGLLGGLVQMFFPKKRKTAKYAGNWDPGSKQPSSYKFQKWLLGNTFLSRNIKVLIYGNWKGSTSNILPFFTASYSEKEITEVEHRDLNGELRMCFVGTLLNGKQPLKSIKVAQALNEKNIKVRLDFFGEGEERKAMEDYIREHKLQDFIFLNGNVDAKTVKEYMKHSHFLLFFSRSEGWPKAVAESMFWGCVPVTSPVSCVPQILDYGNRGILTDADENQISELVIQLIRKPEAYHSMSESAMVWSRQYTLEKFEREIAILI